MCPIKYDDSWKNSTTKNREEEFSKYGEVFIYKDKIVPHNLINKKVRRWFEDYGDNEDY